MSGNHERQLSDAERHQAAGKPMRRARKAAWIVFWVSAGTSVLYNCYDALVPERMPWYTGIPKGAVPLVVAVCVLEYSGAWRENKFLQAVCWLVTCGAMGWSAVVINSVVHNGWALGAICDPASLSAMYFLLNGPTAAQAIAKVVAKERELIERAEAERLARLQAEDRFRADLAAQRGELEAQAERQMAGLAAEIERQSRARADAETALVGARSEADRANERADRLERKLTGPGGRSKPGTGRSRTGLKTAAKTAPRTGIADGAEVAPDDDLDYEAKALNLLVKNPDISGADIAEELGVSPGYGRKLRRRLAENRPSEAGSDRPEDRTGSAGSDRPQDRSGTAEVDRTEDRS